jgi:acetyl-CoA synthetase
MMRRILRKVAVGGSSEDDMGDISTLADPSVVRTLIKHRKELK